MSARRIESVKIGPDDPRYRAVVDKRFNKRFRASPDYVRLAGSTDEVVSAVEEAVREGRRLVVTSGGHCLEGFVSDPDVRVIIDVSPMKRVYYDAERRAVAVEAGATVGETFRALFETLGRRDPARRVSGDRHGRARGRRRLRLPLPPARPRRGLPVRRRGGHRGRGRTGEQRGRDPRAVRSESRPLVGAHRRRAAATSASSRATGSDRPTRPARIPPRCCPRRPSRSPPSRRNGTGATSTSRPSCGSLRNHGIWCERNSGADSPNASLWTLLEIHRKQFGKIVVRGVSTAGAGAERQVDDHLAALSEGSARRRAGSSRGCPGSSSP